MSELLMKLFVRDPSQRHKYGLLAGVVGIMCNVLLATVKVITGIMTGAVSIATDAVNNLSDAVSSVVTLIGFKISGKPADREHPYGHGRVEYITGFVVSAAVIAVAIDLFKESVSNIITPKDLDVSITTIVILAASILLKFWMSSFYNKIANRISSEAMHATAADSRADCITTGVALLSVAVMLIFGKNIDGYAGAVVSVLVMISGLRSAKETIEPLLGTAPDKEKIRAIESEALSHPEIMGVHDMHVHEYGHDIEIVSLHVEVSCDLTLVTAHDVIDAIEHDIVAEGLASEVTIHVDPIAVNDPETMTLREELSSYLKTISPDISIHDFRLIRRESEHSHLIFEILVPYDLTKTDNELRALLCTRIADCGRDYEVAITVDRE